MKLNNKMMTLKRMMTVAILLPLAKAVVFNELMIRPLVGKTQQWVELFNPGNVSVNMDGWTLATKSGGNATVDITGTIAAGAYFMIGQSNDTSANGNVTMNTVSSALSLGKDLDLLVLVNSKLDVIDSVQYDNTFPSNNLTSMSFSQLAKENDYSVNWCNSPNTWSGGNTLMKGTPRSANNCTTAPLPRAVVINEIMKNPLGDNIDQKWLELRNNYNVSVDLNGWSIDIDCSNGGKCSSFSFNDSIIIPANGYIVFGRNESMAVNGNVTIDVTGDFVLGSLNGSVDLLNKNSVFVDKVKYDASFPRKQGASMSLKPPINVDNTVSTSWCDSPLKWSGGTTNMSGTPGLANNCGSTAAPTVVPPPVSPPNALPPTGPAPTAVAPKAPSSPVSPPTVVPPPVSPPNALPPTGPAPTAVAPKASTTAPIGIVAPKAPSPTVAKLPTKAPTLSPTTKAPTSCGLFKLNLFCPIVKCGLLGRLLKRCKTK